VLLAKHNKYSSFFLYLFVSSDIIIMNHNHNKVDYINAVADIGNIGALSVGGALFVLPFYQLYSDCILQNDKLSVKRFTSAPVLK
jgi:hypothetical protein